MPRNTPIKRVPPTLFYSACPDDLSEGEWVMLARFGHPRDANDLCFDIDSYDGAHAHGLARYGYVRLLPGPTRRKWRMVLTEKALKLVPQFATRKASVPC